MQVSVKPVKGETNTGNNTAEYPVIFSIESACPSRLPSRSRPCGVAVARASPRRGRRLRRLAAARGAPAGRRSAAIATTWSTSPSRCRAGSTISTAPWTRSPPGSPASTAVSTGRSRTRPSSATTPTRTPAASSPRRSRSSTRRRTGTVVTAIQGRDYARIYVKDLERGRASVALSPEEQQAVERAMAARSVGETMFPPRAPLRGLMGGLPGPAGE